MKDRFFPCFQCCYRFFYRFTVSFLSFQQCFHHFYRILPKDDVPKTTLLTLFMQYCKEPVFNPEAVRIAKVPVDKLQAGVEKFQLCTTSQKYLSSKHFQLGATSVNTQKWKSKGAENMDNEARKRNNNAPFRRMLKEIRSGEAQEGESVSYLLTVDDIRWLVMDNWAGVSLLSSDTDINELQCVF